MEVVINGEPRIVPNEMRLSELIEELALAPERIAVELNREVVPRAEWKEKNLSENDQLEIVHFVGGGCR